MDFGVDEAEPVLNTLLCDRRGNITAVEQDAPPLAGQGRLPSGYTPCHAMNRGLCSV